MPGSNYAVLFAGGGDPSSNHYRYYESIKKQYNLLVQHKGVNPKDIVLLFADGGKSFNTNLMQMEAYKEESVRSELAAAGAPATLIDRFVGWYDEASKGRVDIESLRDIAAELNPFDVVHLSPDDPSQILYKPDLGFAASLGSAVLPAVKTNLQSVLTDKSSPDSLALRVGAEDHFYLWTFDHGGSNAMLPGSDFADPALGNHATLIAWKDGNSYEIRPDELNAWLAPFIENSGASVSIFNQCFAGGMLQGIEEAISSRPYSYGMSASNYYETSQAFYFAEGVYKALYEGVNTARDVFLNAKRSDPVAVKTDYPDNGGEQISGAEHPWAYENGGGVFDVFLGQSGLHPLVSSGLERLGDSAVNGLSGAFISNANLLEDTTFNVTAFLRDKFGESFQGLQGFATSDHGVLGLEDGDLIYTPIWDFNGKDIVAVRYLNGQGETLDFGVSLNVESVNDGPAAGDDYFAIASRSSGTPLNLDRHPGLLGDFDIDGDPLVLADWGRPQHGSVEMRSDGLLYYVPNAGFSGRDSFTYRITDGSLYSSARVILDVGGGPFTNSRDGYLISSSKSAEEWDPITDFSGLIYSDSTSDMWDVVDAKYDGDSYRVLAEGSGLFSGYFQVWDVSDYGYIVDRGRWYSAQRVVEAGGESFFDRDLNGNGFIQSGGIGLFGQSLSGDLGLSQSVLDASGDWLIAFSPLD